MAVICYLSVNNCVLGMVAKAIPQTNHRFILQSERDYMLLRL
jgi:flagellar biosynthesis protein FliR